MITELSEIARVSLGYKSLQNAFFYVNKATIDTYGIEACFLSPLFMLDSMNAQKFTQALKPVCWLFNCKKKKVDLRGTGALRYVEAMANHAAAAKKQTAKSQTIREALEAQSGEFWYAPKALPHKHHIWVRKAFGAMFAPFLFDKGVLVDQRCNSIDPLPSFEWREIGAVLTTTLFAYSVEVNGSVSMGAGALEAPTTKLRSYPVLDLAQLKSAQRKKLESLAEAVWQSEPPVDWSLPKVTPGPKLRELDEWVLGVLDRDVKLEALYADVHEVCQSRIVVAKDKVKKIKKSKAENIGNVAESISKTILPKVQSRNFPDDFSDSRPSDISFHFDRGSARRILISPFMDTYDIEVFTAAGEKTYEGTHPRPVAEAIVRALLWGRGSFSVGSDAKAMDHALTKFLAWVAEIENDLEAAIRDSALGTGYEESLKREVYRRLGIHPMVAIKTLPSEITL